MAISVVMPALEMAQESGKLLAWRKTEGDFVRKGEPLLEIETDKATVEIESPGEGILAGVTAEVGDVVPVGETIAWLVAPGEKPPEKAASSAARGRAGMAATAPTAEPSQATPAPARSTVAQISPRARRLAKDLNVDIAQIRGTGPDGTITSEDVEAFKANSMKKSTSPVTGGAGVRALSQIARLMAERTTQSWTSVPHFFLVQTVDVTKLIETQRQLKAKTAENPSTITDFLIAIVARVLVRHPRMNANWTGDGIHNNPDVNISVAMAVKDGVVGTVIPKADTKPLADISALRRELTERASAGKLRPADISNGTFTISNLGMYKIEAFTAIITPPQVAVLAVGAVTDTVVARDGKPTVRPAMTLTLSSDHRVVDGARAAEFLAELATALLDPENYL